MAPPVDPTQLDPVLQARDAHAFTSMIDHRLLDFDPDHLCRPGVANERNCWSPDPAADVEYPAFVDPKTSDDPADLIESAGGEEAFTVDELHGLGDPVVVSSRPDFGFCHRDRSARCRWYHTVTTRGSDSGVTNVTLPVDGDYRCL